MDWTIILTLFFYGWFLRIIKKRFKNEFVQLLLEICTIAGAYLILS